MSEAVMSEDKGLKLLTKKQAGRRLGYSEQYTKKLIQQGVLEAESVSIPGGGRAKLISSSTIDDVTESWGDDDGMTLTPAQAADTLNCCVDTIYRYCREKKLTPIRRGPNCYLRVRLREVTKLLRNR